MPLELSLASREKKGITNYFQTATTIGSGFATHTGSKAGSSTSLRGACPESVQHGGALSAELEKP